MRKAKYREIPYTLPLYQSGFPRILSRIRPRPRPQDPRILGVGGGVGGYSDVFKYVYFVNLDTFKYI